MIIRLLKLISLSFIIFLMAIGGYRLFIENLPETSTLDNSRIQRVLEEQKIAFGNKTYYELLALMGEKGDKPHIYTIEEHGVSYKLEVSSFWLNEYKKGGDIIVSFLIYNRFLTTQNPLRDTLVKSKER